MKDVFFHQRRVDSFFVSGCLLVEVVQEGTCPSQQQQKLKMANDCLYPFVYYQLGKTNNLPPINMSIKRKNMIFKCWAAMAYYFLVNNKNLRFFIYSTTRCLSSKLHIAQVLTLLS